MIVYGQRKVTTMIDNYLLEELASFAKNKTLAKTAEELSLSQPAITRGTQKLEDELGVKLFERTPNKISLNATGEFAAKKAAALLAANRDFAKSVQDFDRSQKEVTAAAAAPGPLIVLNQVQLDNVSIADSFIAPEQTKSALLNEQYTIVFSTQQLTGKDFASSFLGSEQLVANLNEFTPQASQTKVAFADLHGLTFLVLQDIGPWRKLIQEKIPDARFLYQTKRRDFDEIKNYSIFPYFTTNLTGFDKKRRLKDRVDRVPVPISDPEASMTFYANYLKKNAARVAPLVEKMQDVWAQAD